MTVRIRSRHTAAEQRGLSTIAIAALRAALRTTPATASLYHLKGRQPCC